MTSSSRPSSGLMRLNLTPALRPACACSVKSVSPNGSGSPLYVRVSSGSKMNSTLLDLPALPTLVSVADRSSMVSATWYLHQLWLLPSLQGGFAHGGSSGNVVAGGGGGGNTVVALKVSGARSVPGSWNGSPSPLSSGAAQISVSPQRSGPAF